MIETFNIKREITVQKLEMHTHIFCITFEHIIHISRHGSQLFSGVLHRCIYCVLSEMWAVKCHPMTHLLHP